MSTGQHPRLPHHRRIDERRTDPGDRVAIRTAMAIGYVLCVLALVYLAAIVAGSA